MRQRFAPRDFRRAERVLLVRMSPVVARLRHADCFRECLFSGLDRKWQASGQIDAFDLNPTQGLIAAGVCFYRFADAVLVG
jgi:hypothetical protein